MGFGISCNMISIPESRILSNNQLKIKQNNNNNDEYDYIMDNNENNNEIFKYSNFNNDIHNNMNFDSLIFPSKTIVSKMKVLKTKKLKENV